MLVKSLVIDSADNWGDSSYVGIRSVELYSGGVLHEVTNEDITCYNANYSAYEPELAFITSLSKTGSPTGTSWVDYDGVTRLICVFDDPVEFDQVVINNYHSSGGYTSRGTQNTKITITEETYVTETYDAAVTGGWVLFNGVIPQHAASDAAQDYDIPLISYSYLPTVSSTAHIYFNPYMQGTLPSLESEGTVAFNPFVDATLPTIRLTTPEHVTATLDSDLPTLSLLSAIGYNMTVDATLPYLRIEAEFGERCYVDSRLPLLECEARTGSKVDANLPEMKLTAVGLAGAVGVLDKPLPDLQIEAVMGSQVDSKLPTIGIEAELTTPVLCTVAKTLPGLKCEAAATGGAITLASIIPFPKITANASVNGIGTVDLDIPAMRISATGLSGSTSALDATLPDLRIESASYSVIIELDAYLPQLTTDVATGKDSGNVDNIMSTDREFELLRYAR